VPRWAHSSRTAKTARYPAPVTDMWSSLLPLIAGSAFEPIELIITIMLLGTPSRARAAGAWVGGHVSTRLLQGLIFGTILHWGKRDAGSNHAHHWIVSTVLLVVAVLFLVTMARAIFGADDPDAPSPKWMTMLTSASPTQAFLIGAAIVTVSIKAWVFTLAAISVIGNAELSRAAHVVSYILFVALAAIGNLLIVGLAAIFPGRSRPVLDRTLAWLQHNDRPIMIVVGLVFGVWFGIKALHGFGIL
ncbi:hypothetical protein MAAFP003_2934, partial [Mycobacterium ahvazicum]